MAVDIQKPSAFTADDRGAAYAVPRVNLLPPEIAAERAFKRTQLGLGATALVVAGLVAGGYVFAAAAADSAREDLVAEQARTQQLQGEQAQYAEVPLVLSQVEQAQAGRATAMASDVLWFDYLKHMAATYPKNIWLKDLTVASGAAAAATAPATVPVTPGAVTQNQVATLTFSGSGLSHDDVAAWLDVLAETPGFADPTYSTATRTEIDGRIVVDFTSTVSVTADALSHRFDPETS